MRKFIPVGRRARLAALIITLAITSVGLSACVEGNHSKEDTPASALGGWR